MHNLADIVGCEHYHVGCYRTGEVHVDEIVMRYRGVVVNEQPHEHHDVTALQLGWCHGGLHFLDVEQAVDETQHVLSVPDNHLSQLLVFLGICLVAFKQPLSSSHDDRQRGLQLVGDVVEEDGPHILDLLLYLQRLFALAPVEQRPGKQGCQYEEESKAAPLEQTDEPMALLVYLVVFQIEGSGFHHVHLYGCHLVDHRVAQCGVSLQVYQRHAGVDVAHGFPQAALGFALHLG